MIIGGGVGSHFEKFSAPLNDEMKKLELPMVNIPPIIKAKRAEEAVVYGCYDYINQKLNSPSGNAAGDLDSFQTRRDEKPRRGVL